MEPEISLNEILLKAGLDRSTLFIFVEGPYDRVLVKSALAGHADAVSVREMDLLRLPKEDAGRGVGGNRARLLSLASTVDKQPGIDNLIAIIDTDFDAVLNSPESYCAIKYTDFSCMEAYTLTRGDISTGIALTLNIGIPDETIDFLLRWIRDFFLLLAARASCGIEKKFPAVDNYFSWESNQDFDWKKYISAIRSAGLSQEDHEKVIRKFNVLRRDKLPDERHYIHFETFVDVFALTCRKKLGKKVDRETLSGALRLVARSANLSEFPLFLGLAGRLGKFEARKATPV